MSRRVPPLAAAVRLLRAMRSVRAAGADRTGAMAIETAIVAPILILLSVGSFQVSTMVARQNELQSAASLAAAIVMSKNPGTQADLDLIKATLVATTKLDPSNVSVSYSYRCNTSTTRTSNKGSCDPDLPIWTYVRVGLANQYVPIWTALGVGSPVALHVTRTVQTS